MIGTLPYLFSRAYHAEYLIIAGLPFKALIFKAPSTNNGRLRPLHVDIHGGAFIGGLPENMAVFDERVDKETGAVVVSISFRLAPEHVFPAAIVTFYAAINLRLKPSEKQRPASFPKNDPLAMMLPLYDAYASPVRAANMNNPRMNPTLAAKETLPPRILLVVPGADILVAEQMAFAERVNREGGNVDVFYEEKPITDTWTVSDPNRSRRS